VCVWGGGTAEAHSLLADQPHVAVPELNAAFPQVEEGRISREGAVDDALAILPARTLAADELGTELLEIQAVLHGPAAALTVMAAESNTLRCWSWK